MRNGIASQVFASILVSNLLITTCFISPLTTLSSGQGQIVEGRAMDKYIVIEKPSLMIVGIECRTSNTAEAAPLDIPRLWARFYSENIAGQIPNKVSDEVIALYCDYEGDYTQPYTTIIGCPVSSLDNVPEGLVTKVIPGGTYALYRAIGEHPKSLIETWGAIWQTDLDRTYSGDYEVYGENFISESPKKVDVYVAIQSR